MRSLDCVLARLYLTHSQESLCTPARKRLQLASYRSGRTSGRERDVRATRK